MILKNVAEWFVEKGGKLDLIHHAKRVMQLGYQNPQFNPPLDRNYEILNSKRKKSNFYNYIIQNKIK